jgi:hypothetical protein
VVTQAPPLLAGSPAPIAVEPAPLATVNEVPKPPIPTPPTPKVSKLPKVEVANKAKVAKPIDSDKPPLNNQERTLVAAEPEEVVVAPKANVKTALPLPLSVPVPFPSFSVSGTPALTEGSFWNYQRSDVRLNETPRKTLEEFQILAVEPNGYRMMIQTG